MTGIWIDGCTLYRKMYVGRREMDGLDGPIFRIKFQIKLHRFKIIKNESEDGINNNFFCFKFLEQIKLKQYFAIIEQIDSK